MKHGVTIYYDPDCGFCLRICRKIKKYLFLSNAEIKVITSDKDAYAIFLREYSWVVFESHTGKYYSKSSAWWVLVRVSPFSFLYVLTYIPGMIWLGDMLYEVVADNRPKTCRV